MSSSPQERETLGRCLADVFFFQREQTVISSGKVVDLTKFIIDHQPSQLINTLDRIWAPPPIVTVVELLSGDNDVWSTYNIYNPPADYDILAMDTIGRQILELSQQNDDMGQSAQQLLDFFVEALHQISSNIGIQDWRSMMMSEFKFFHILRSITLKDGTRPFNDLLIKKSAFDKVYSNKRSFIDTMLGVVCTRPILFDRPARSTELINYYANLISNTRVLVKTKTLQEQVIHQANQMIQQLQVSSFSIFGGKKNKTL